MTEIQINCYVCGRLIARGDGKMKVRCLHNCEPPLLDGEPLKR